MTEKKQKTDAFRVERALAIDAVTSIHYFEFDDTFVDEAESHEPWELVFVDRGACAVVANGQEILLNQGEMYFHQPWETHKLKTVKGVAPNVFIITFLSHSPAMRRFADRKLIATLSAKQHISAILHEAESTYEMPFNSPRMQLLKLKPRDALFAGEQTILSRLELMLIEFVRADKEEAVKPRTFHSREVIGDAFALRIIAYMEKNLYNRFSVEDLCAELSFGRTYVSNYFSRVCGTTLLNYYTMMKVGEAKRLIRESGKNFSEISEMLLFTNPHYFSTIFKKYAGMTPSQYKRSCRME